jgi:MOSC domain-containing protein YiiM
MGLWLRRNGGGVFGIVQGIVESIFIAEVGGGAMCRIAEVEAIAGLGLKGDRYAAGKGYWTQSEGCQVTLIEAEHLDLIRASGRLQVSNGEHRRNIVTRGLSLGELNGKRLRVGEALLIYDRPRPPCYYLATLTERTLPKMLWKRGGICARVAEGGLIRTGDAITVLEGVNEPSVLQT